MDQMALTGIRVVDLSGCIATGYCGKLFADYGAEVINLEPEAGFSTRLLAPQIPDHGSAMHAYLNTNKKSVLMAELDEVEIAALIGSAQLVLDSGDTVLSRHCTAVHTSVVWYGEGPYQDFTGTDSQCFALNGMLKNIGTVDGPPIIPTGYQAQIIGGLTAYIASLTQVLAQELNCRELTHVETSIFEAMMCFTEVGGVAAYNFNIEGSRMGINRFPPTYPLGVFPCKDGWLGVTVLTPSQWRAFCALLELEELADVALFQTTVGRLEAVDIIEPMIKEKLLLHSAEDLFYRGQHARIPLARVPTMEELFHVDQFNARQAFSTAETGDYSLTVPSVPFRLFTTPPHFGGRVATLGENTGEYVT